MKKLIERFEESVFRDDASPFPSNVEVGAPKSRVLVIVGPNASGKSLAFRLLAGVAHDDKTPIITLSIRERTGSGMSDMSGMRRVMIYGDETQQSTGALSVSVIERGFANVRKRLEDKNAHGTLLMLDEPELGLSDGYARALGTYLAQQVNELPAAAPGLVLITHSRPMVEALCDAMGTAPHAILMGSETTSLKAWLNATESFTVEDLINLPEKGHAGRKAFEAFVQDLKKPKPSKAKRRPR